MMPDSDIIRVLVLPEFSVDKITVAVFQTESKVCVIGYSNDKQELLLIADSSDKSSATVKRGVRHEIRLFVKNS